ncbi:hypothetical protein [Massilia sp. 9I]|uniref:hypothetical protein n=1 Tax=Massilia sp. 9I TaxID=2653152 RepID=UPI00135CE568|nr:hypothetical protein [Massilia sp. 9I]
MNPEAAAPCKKNVRQRINQTAMWPSLKPAVALLLISLSLSLVSSWVPARVIDIVPGSEDCQTGCLAAAAGWPVAYIVDGHGLSPGGSADLIGMLLGLDRLDGPRALGNWLFWLVMAWVVRAGLAAWRGRA